MNFRSWFLCKFTEERALNSRYHSRFFVRVGHETTSAIGNHNFFTIYIVRPTKIIKDFCKASTNLDSIYELALQRSLIILVDLPMTSFRRKKSYSHAQLAQKLNSPLPGFDNLTMATAKST